MKDEIYKILNDNRELKISNKKKRSLIKKQHKELFSKESEHGKMLVKYHWYLKEKDKNGKYHESTQEWIIYKNGTIVKLDEDNEDGEKVIENGISKDDEKEFLRLLDNVPKGGTGIYNDRNFTINMEEIITTSKGDEIGLTKLVATKPEKEFKKFCKKLGLYVWMNTPAKRKKKP